MRRNSINVDNAMMEAFSELLALLPPEELRDRLKGVPPGPIGNLYGILNEFENEFENECNGCEYYIGMPPRCSLPSLKACPKIE